MKLPDPRDPRGDKEGALPRAHVLETLVKNGVSITPLGGDQLQLEKGEALEVYSLPETVGGVMINYIARKFGIFMPDFYAAHRDITH